MPMDARPFLTIHFLHIFRGSQRIFVVFLSWGGGLPQMNNPAALEKEPFPRNSSAAKPKQPQTNLHSHNCPNSRKNHKTSLKIWNFQTWSWKKCPYGMTKASLYLIMHYYAPLTGGNRWKPSRIHEYVMSVLNGLRSCHAIFNKTWNI